MRVVHDGRTATGRAVDLRDAAVSTKRALRAVRSNGVVGSECDDGATLRVDCPDPGPVHDEVGLLEPGTTVRSRRALAAVARAIGESPPQADRIARLERELADLEAGEDAAVDRRAARRRVADAGEREAELGERVAALRGALAERRRLDEPTEELAADLREAVRELTEVETARVAAEESLAAARRVATTERDARERGLALEDDLANARRAARRWLAARVDAAFVDALAVVPGEATPGETPGTYEGDDLTAALAVVRVASLRAPAVVACGRFDSAEDAARTLDTSVLTV